MYMKITVTSMILGIVGPRSWSQHNFEIFLHLLQCKLSGPKPNFATSYRDIDKVRGKREILRSRRKHGPSAEGSK